MTEIGTLSELNVRPGDVVECIKSATASFARGFRYTVVRCDDGVGVIDDTGNLIHSSISDFRLISRASDDTPKTWREMTDAEKVALLLASHDGRVIEIWSDIDPEWLECPFPKWTYSCAYRIKPEPKRETVELYGAKHADNWPFERDSRASYDTHRITFDTIDGKPDCASIKMEEL